MARWSWGVGLLLGAAIIAEEPPVLPGVGDEEALQSALAEAAEQGQLNMRLRLQELSDGLRGVRLYQRLEWRNSRGHEAYLLTEKDPGETQWADFAAFYLQWQSRFKPLQILVGDVRPGFGQGLVFSRSGSGRSTASAILKNDSKSIGYRASAENQALRGLVLRYRGRRFEGVILAGRVERDARLDEDGRAVSLPDGGVHVSATERAGRKRLQAWSGGLRLRYLARHWQGGISLQGMHFNRWVDLRRPGKTPWAFQGRHQYLGGVDFRVSAGAARSALEAGRDLRGNWGFLHTLQLELGRVRLRGLVRYYAPGFHSFFGAAASAAGMQNERGYLLALEGRWRRQAWRIMLDQYAQLQPSFTNPMPGPAQVWSCSTERPLAPHWRLQLLYQNRTRPRWQGGEAHAEHSRRGRLGLDYRSRDGTRVGLRLEGRYLHDSGRPDETGGLLSLVWQGRRRGSRYAFHLSRFLTASYSTRIYEFEYHLPGTASIRPLYGDGWRFYVLGGLQWRFLYFTGRYRYQHSQSRGHALHNIGLQVDLQIGQGGG